VRDGVYVGVAQGLDAGSGEVNVEVELTDDISLDGGVGTTGDTKVGVTWERDY
jgi:autotransporter translocation and assembly factor TamB